MKRKHRKSFACVESSRKGGRIKFVVTSGEREGDKAQVVELSRRIGRGALLGTLNSDHPWAPTMKKESEKNFGEM